MIEGFTYLSIGMALSVATGSNFVVLLIAITFHRELFPSFHAIRHLYPWTIRQIHASPDF